MDKRLMVAAVLLLGMGVNESRAGIVQEQQAQIDELFARVEVLEAQNAALAALLAGVSRNGDTLLLTGMNLQLVNGLGATDGDTGGGPAVNGLGNLVIGYDEIYCPVIGDCFEKTGSHNLVIGAEHGYDSFAGMVVGTRHRSQGPYAVVVGGYGNTASAEGAGVFGGSVNSAESTGSAVFGGHMNYVHNWWAVASGGYDNSVTGLQASVFGGHGNQSTAFGANVSGGLGNLSSGDWSTVSGGTERTADGEFDWVAGGLFEDE